MSDAYFSGRISIAAAVCILVLSAIASCHGGAADGRRDITEIAPCLSIENDADEAKARALQDATARPVIVQFGDDIPGPLRSRVLRHLEAASAGEVTERPAMDAFEDDLGDVLLLGFGNTTATRAVIAASDLEDLGDEGYALHSAKLGAATVIATDGAEQGRAGVADVGVLYGTYALLEELGFAFLHPLRPTTPHVLPTTVAALRRATSPRWPIRGLQLHTMHPLELTNLLQGWGEDGPWDRESWESMLGEWDAFLEWLLANGQNRVHWVWLAASSWGSFADSTERMARIRLLVERAHAFGIEVGLDVPLRLQQQHAGRLIRKTGNLDDENRQIREGVEHVMTAGFDYLVTEAGSTEFTAVDDLRMVAWMNELTRVAADEHGVETFIKVHASTGQHAKTFEDPDGGALNFNFLPHFADRRLGVLPHTVQHYALDDPAPTYGNRDFTHIREFLQEEAGRRPTVWHPETAYWVSFDVDVPLFLPVYASRRVHDLRLLAADEDAGRMGRGDHAGSRMDGQLTFSSGWEWGYWLQEVVTARGAWDPGAGLESDEAAFRAHLRPLRRVFGSAGDPLVDWIVDYSDAQQALLIEGRVDGVRPLSIERRNGQAYLQGWETWDDISDQLADELGLEHGRMQPERIGLADMHRRGFERSEYLEVEPLLREMDGTFAELAARLEAMEPDIPLPALELYEELLDAARMTELRARQIRALYAFVDATYHGDPDDAADLLSTARDAVDEGLSVVAHRETHYRVPADRIAGWHDNPTVYPFTYLWTVRSLYYWQRDEEIAARGERNPCLHNIIDPVDVGLGAGRISRMVDRFAGAWGSLSGAGGFTECMRAPSREPDFLPARWPGR